MVLNMYRADFLFESTSAVLKDMLQRQKHIKMCAIHMQAGHNPESPLTVRFSSSIQ